MSTKQRAPRNKTITLTDEDRRALRPLLATPSQALSEFSDRTFLGDCVAIAPLLPRAFVDLLFLDPPYNLNKRFGDVDFTRRPVEEYTQWLSHLLDVLLPTLKPTATVYICGDWHTSTSIFAAASERLHIRNRITWEREKGRGAKRNWKNTSEDIWFCTASHVFTFDVDAVKLRRRVIAPYRNRDGTPRDWHETPGGNFRDTHPSNLWTDITIPFWSMSENTDHPTQKSEKLLAKLILASTRPGDIVLDPFLGSGTSSVVARKLGRHYIGIEIIEEYALLAEKRLAIAAADATIQGYADRVFWERNTLSGRNTRRRPKEDPQEDEPQAEIF
jgi:site-specific DNA-methyltransferase (adenine-specific)